MCRLQHIEWRCRHAQTIYLYCSAAPPLHPPATFLKSPCPSFIQRYGPDRVEPTEGEYRNHCCSFSCCLADQAALTKEIRDLEGQLRMEGNEELPFLPKFLMSQRQVLLKGKRREWKRVRGRHEERCEALYYGLGWCTGESEWKRDIKDPVLMKDEGKGKGEGGMAGGGEGEGAEAEMEERQIEREERKEMEAEQRREESRGRKPKALGTLLETNSLRSRSTSQEETVIRRQVPDWYRHSH